MERSCVSFVSLDNQTRTLLLSQVLNWGVWQEEVTVEGEEAEADLM